MALTSTAGAAAAAAVNYDGTEVVDHPPSASYGFVHDDLRSAEDVLYPERASGIVILKQDTVIQQFVREVGVPVLFHDAALLELQTAWVHREIMPGDFLEAGKTVTGGKNGDVKTTSGDNESVFAKACEATTNGLNNQLRTVNASLATKRFGEAPGSCSEWFTENFLGDPRASSEYVIGSDVVNSTDTLADPFTDRSFYTDSKECSMLEMAMSELRVNVVLALLARPDLNSALITSSVYEKALSYALDRGFGIQSRSSFSYNAAARRENADGLDARSDTRVAASAVLNLFPPRGFDLWQSICALFQMKIREATMRVTTVTEDVLETGQWCDEVVGTRTSTGGAANGKSNARFGHDQQEEDEAVEVEVASSSPVKRTGEERKINAAAAAGADADDSPTTERQTSTTRRPGASRRFLHKRVHKWYQFELKSIEAESRSVAKYDEEVLTAIETYMGMGIYSDTYNTSCLDRRVFTDAALRCLKQEYYKWKREQRPKHILGLHCCGVQWKNLRCELVERQVVSTVVAAPVEQAGGQKKKQQAESLAQQRKYQTELRDVMEGYWG
ncbi:unnamed protein product [Amoebophrya sp. A120]|nr:unnamed protein product [Amoebophrya sp. A120]|eukprot:GSA120T00001412001.1